MSLVGSCPNVAEEDLNIRLSSLTSLHLRCHDCTKPALSSALGFDSDFLRQVVVEELPPAALHTLSLGLPGCEMSATSLVFGHLLSLSISSKP